MGLFDWFQPDPPLICLSCRRGTVSGWQDKHSRHGLFLWQQHRAAPIAHPVDDEFAFPPEILATRRLPTDEDLCIYFGKCDECGACFPYPLHLAFTGDTWTGFTGSHRVRIAREPLPGWLECPDCRSLEEVLLPGPAAECPACRILLLRSPRCE